jgi:hypothetical protein
VGSDLYRAATTKYLCYVPILEDSEGAGRTGLPMFSSKAGAKVILFLLTCKYFWENLAIRLNYRTFAVENMKPIEFYQLKAFAKQDGALLALLWLAALYCYIQGLTNPLLGLVALVLIVISPFYAASRLRHFRDYGREGSISFGRGYVYMVLTFFYAGLLMAAVLYAYFAFIDKGYLAGKFTEMMNSTEGQQALQAYGMADQMKEALREMSELRPIDYALNMLTFNIMTGMLLGLPIAAFMQRQVANSNIEEEEQE